jgi:hypothetical protein
MVFAAKTTRCARENEIGQQHQFFKALKFKRLIRGNSLLLIPLFLGCMET